MIRSLWSAATGMNAQQTNMDVIANNLANVNTAGYKTGVGEFKTLLYQTLQTKTTTANGAPKPVSAQVGLGVRTSAVTTIFRQGSAQESSNPTAFMLDGKGFFAVRGDDQRIYYTRNGNFNISVGTTGAALCDFEGRPVLDTQNRPIVFGANIVASNLVITNDGQFLYPDAAGVARPLGISVGVFQFTNPAGLERRDGSIYGVTPASGAVMNEAAVPTLEKSKVRQGYLEMSNVQVADEMVNMIVTQRAYELNSKAITTSDEMMGQANSLRR